MISIPVEGDVLYKSRAEVLAAMLAAWALRIPDIHTGSDGILYALTDIEAGQIEGLYIANQILLEDSFVPSASPQALDAHGEQYGVPRKLGTPSSGFVLFSGAGGTVIPVGTEVAYDPGLGEESVLVFETTDVSEIPSPGVPSPPTLAVGSAGSLTGDFEYVITFVTSSGETTPGAASDPITASADQIQLTDIAVGGPGTVARRVYRRALGGTFRRVVTLNDNSTTAYVDDVTLAGTEPEPPSISTAEAVSVPATSEDTGAIYNVVAGAITTVNDAPDGVTDVTNTSPFTGGSDQEDTEVYRARLLDHLRAPQVGSPEDLENWAKEIDGVEEATAFTNDNVGTPTNGHVTVRISGPDGTIPDSSVQAAVQEALDDRDLANITIHVATFTSVSTNVTVTVTLESGFTLAEVSPSVDSAIRDYINSLPVGGTLYLAGIYDAVFGITGVATLVVNSPGTDQSTAATSKRVPGTITVN